MWALGFAGAPANPSARGGRWPAAGARRRMAGCSTAMDGVAEVGCGCSMAMDGAEEEGRVAERKKRHKY